MNQDELKVLEERIKANPKSRSFLQLAEAYIEMGRRSEALELLRNGEEYYPYYLAARIAYGKLLREEGDLDRSIDQFEFVNRTIPDNLLALKNLAELYLAKDRFPEASEMANAAMALSPNDPEMMEVLKKTESEKPAQEISEETTEALPEEPIQANAPIEEETIVEMPHELFTEASSRDEEITPESKPEPAQTPPEEILQEEPVAVATEPTEEPVQPQNAETDSSSPLPQTETMGDLLFEQGHLEEALSIYEAALARNPQSPSLPEKIQAIKATLQKSAIEPPAVETPEEIPADIQQEEEIPVLVMAEPGESPDMETEALGSEDTESLGKYDEPDLAGPEHVSLSSFSEGLSGQIVDRIRDRMGRELIGYVSSTLDGLSTEASDNGHWADVLAAEGVEIVRAVMDMTRMLNWGDLDGTVVWMERAVLYGLPVHRNEALFLALKPGANVGLCRLLVAQVVEDARTRENLG